MTNDKPASDGGADDSARLMAQLAASTLAAIDLSAAISQKPPKKRSIWHRFRSAVSGLFVSRKYAEANPDTTIREKAD